MRRDDEFTEYVEMRWSLLYRYAALLAGEPAAETMTRAALVRAYAVWADVVESWSRDEFVKGLVGDQVASRVRAELRGKVPEAIPASMPGNVLVPGRPDADPISERIDTLPFLHRALLGLGCRDDAEEAGDLGSADAERLTRAAVAAVLAPEQTESDLRAALRRGAEDVFPPLPPVAELLAAAHQASTRHRRRQSALVTGAVAVLLGASVLVAATDPETGAPRNPRGQPGVPLRMADVPAGAPPRAAYSDGNVLDFGPAEVLLPRAPRSLAQAGADLVITYPDGRIELFATATRSRALLATRSEGDPVVDPEGHWVAWKLPWERPGVVVAVSLTGKGRHQQTFPVVRACCDEPFLLHGITSSGQLVASMPIDGTTWVWDLDNDGGPGPVMLVEGLDRLVVTGIAGDQIVAVDRSAPALGAVVGSLDGHAFESRFSTDRREPDFSVPGWIVYTAWDGTIRARRLPWAPPGDGRGPREVTLRLPPDLIRTTLRREFGTTVVMDVRTQVRTNSPTGYLVRCDLVTGACQNVAQPAGPHHLAR